MSPAVFAESVSPAGHGGQTGQFLIHDRSSSNVFFRFKLLFKHTHATHTRTRDNRKNIVYERCSVVIFTCSVRVPIFGLLFSFDFGATNGDCIYFCDPSNTFFSYAHLGFPLEINTKNTILEKKTQITITVFFPYH